MAVLASRAAQAGVYFDSADVGSAYTNMGTASVMAQSFAVTGTPNLSVTLDLSANNPADGGSILVYIVADDGSGGKNAGAPLLAINGSGAVTGFDPTSVLVNTIPDSSLSSIANGPSAVTFNVPGSALAATNFTAGDEYWIGLATGTTGDAWWANGDGSGIGTSGQSFYTNATLTNTLSASNVGGSQAFQAIISDATTSNTPEPATLAIIGVGLAGIGYVRRRKNTKA
jgi:hypothetical protein